ncbi:MAG: SRPBCC domain-containing protein [Sphingobacteriales bacterium]|nr:SRPBCC domain-containing protein [Sphingobacteriales bacterium]
MAKSLIVKRVFNCSAEVVWKLWSEPAYVKQWWGPDQFTCPLADIHFEVGKSSLVAMKAPGEMGGRVSYNLWTYTKIEPYKRIEYLQNMADAEGNKRRPVEVGMPADFPEDILTVVTFTSLGENETEVVVTEFADFGQMSHFAKIGLEQCLNKALRLF